MRNPICLAARQHLFSQPFALIALVLSTCGFPATVAPLSAQPFQVGDTWFGINQYIEYQPGNYPLIIAAAHGGTLSPMEIPDRNCADCVYTMDVFTEDLARRMAAAVEASTGCRPHLIINRLHRRKLDANRGFIEGADGNPLAEQAWEDFHRFIQAAKDTVAHRFSKGLFIDLHGHGHSLQRIELGYLLYGSELAQSDSMLNSSTFVSYSSIRGLVLDNRQQLNHADLLRGPESLGSLFADFSFPSVPSTTIPFPGIGNPYFSGGYNTERHGSMITGSIDAIQMECNYNGVRDTPANRQEFAESSAMALTQFLQYHYFGTSFPHGLCVPLSLDAEPAISNLKVYPNPASDWLTVELSARPFSGEIVIFDALGKQVLHTGQDHVRVLEIPLRGLSSGWYVLQIHAGNSVYSAPFFKN